MGVSDAVASALLMALAAAVQGFLGFGFGIVAMTGLTLQHDLIHAAGVVNLSGLVVVVVNLWQLRRHVLWKTAARIVPAILVGVVVGVSALREVDRELMVRLLGATVIAIAAWNLLAQRLRTHETPVWDVLIGGVGGVLGGAFNIGGPPLVAHIYRRADPPAALRATIQVLFLSISLCRAPIATYQGLMSTEVVRQSLFSLPAVLIGLAIGLALGSRTQPERFRAVSWVALGALGFLLLVG